MANNEIMKVAQKAVVGTGSGVVGGLAGCSGGAALGFLVGGPVGAALGWGVGMIAGATGGGIVGKKISGIVNISSVPKYPKFI